MIYFILILLNFIGYANQAEPQISFAKNQQSIEYYVEQAELWWKEVEKDNKSEINWYNYFRASRNANGTYDWRSDFLELSPYLKEGAEIVKLIKEAIPNTFTYYYCSFLTNGIGVENYQNLLKAYEMNPNFVGIHSSMISYAESSMNYDFRKKVNKEWYQTNYFSTDLLNYSYNVLNSMDKNSILFVQNDNDTYPLWLLQDALEIRPDVLIINIDFMLLDDYRKNIFEKLKIKNIDLGEIDIDEYRGNWKKALQYIINNYQGNKNIHLGLTLYNELYNDLNDKLYISGLTLKYSKEKIDTLKLNLNFYENIFNLDYLKNDFYFSKNENNINVQNLNYVNMFSELYPYYLNNKEIEKANELKELSVKIASKLNNEKVNDEVKNLFKN